MRMFRTMGSSFGIACSVSLIALGTANAQTTSGQSSTSTAPAPTEKTPTPLAETPNGASPQPTASDNADGARPRADSEQAASSEIVVTGSRLSLRGYQQPTPVSVIGAEKLERDNRTDLASTLIELPAVGPSQSTSSGLGNQALSTGTAGLALINLRGLGVPRTLTLFDGVRVAQSAEGGGVDLNLLPSSLVERIDVVTGGASAAWGSDAVSGVVNVILNKRFKGLSGNVEGSANDGADRRQVKGELSFGTDLGSNTHLIVSGAYLYSPDRVIPSDLSWYKSQKLVNNPAYTAANGQPRLIHADQVGMANATQGGLIPADRCAAPNSWQTGFPLPLISVTSR